MTILHVRNVPDKLYERLQRRAEAQRRSLSAEVIYLLDWAPEESEWPAETTLAAIRARRLARPSVGAPDSVTLLQEDRQR